MLSISGSGRRKSTLTHFSEGKDGQQGFANLDRPRHSDSVTQGSGTSHSHSPSPASQSSATVELPSIQVHSAEQAQQHVSASKKGRGRLSDMRFPQVARTPTASPQPAPHQSPNGNGSVDHPIVDNSTPESQEAPKEQQVDDFERPDHWPKHWTIDLTNASRSVRIKFYLNTLLEDPSSSTLARWLAIIILTLIGVSTTAFVIETLPPLRQQEPDVWLAIEACCVILFTIEYCLRLFACTAAQEGSGKYWTFVKSPLNVIDLLAIAPFYVERIAFWVSNGSSSSGGMLLVFRVIRLARVFRVFKLSRYSKDMQVFGEAFFRSKELLGVLVFFLSLAVIIFSSIMYFVERGVWNDDTDQYEVDDEVYSIELGQFVGFVRRSDFQSIPEVFWWCIVTMTTLGYGDVTPATTEGKLVASLTMICGILVIALPVSILGANFQEAWQESKAEAAAKVRQQRLASDKKDGNSDVGELINLSIKFQERKKEVLDTMRELQEFLGDYGRHDLETCVHYMNLSLTADLEGTADLLARCEETWEAFRPKKSGGLWKAKVTSLINAKRLIRK